MDQLGFKAAAKAWFAAGGGLIAALGFEIGSEFLDPDSDTINWMVVVAAPVVAYAMAWIAPKNEG